MLKRIAITGPESTGKSQMAEKLARHFNTVFVPEIARDYIDQLNRPYTQDDILQIAKNQLELEEEAAKKTDGLLFCDTEFLVTKIWSEHKYNNCHPWIQKMYKVHVYDLYLLMEVDLPWQPDPQREHPHLRKFFFDCYYKELDQQGFRFEVVNGQGENRLKNAIRIVDGFLGGVSCPEIGLQKK
ncbi:MAG: ATP-binding protein [Bacteroidales bacterium]|nr:ATP-binding protein [Bacteroidales bacterium]MCF8344451.1 ATP-binding protein [Bacteroidales bacterium]MCF8351597.1 ATP-binding protein [Bacteroidales bacterium]MCF8375279.1 ATP-binding protein [Bacteroidales bacterium]MCF8401247.1 ATP-binding protein [Bacteroidales bacterium]